MVEHKDESKTVARSRAKEDREEGSKVSTAGLHIDVEGHVVDPAYAPYSGQTAALKLAEEDKLMEAEAVKLREELRTSARAENEADNVQGRADYEKIREEEAKARIEEEHRRQEEGEEAVKNWEEKVEIFPVELKAVDGEAPPGEDYEPEMPVLTEAPTKRASKDKDEDEPKPKAPVKTP